MIYGMLKACTFIYFLFIFKVKTVRTDLKRILLVTVTLRILKWSPITMYKACLIQNRQVDKTLKESTKNELVIKNILFKDILFNDKSTPLHTYCNVISLLVYLAVVAQSWDHFCQLVTLPPCRLTCHRNKSAEICT